MKPAGSYKLVAVASLLVLVGLDLALRWGTDPQRNHDRKTLLLFCAAGLKPALDPATRDYQAITGTRVEVQYGGSGTLLSNIEIVEQGDLYLAADNSYLTTGREKGLLTNVTHLVQMRPVIAVTAGNPKAIGSLEDLTRQEVRLVLANPEAAAIGKVTREHLEGTGQWRSLAEHAIAFKPTVNDLANDLKLGSADATLIWDATAAQYDELEALPANFFGDARSSVGIAVLTHSKQPNDALQFIAYLSQPENIRRYFSPQGYTPIPDEPGSGPEVGP